MKLNKRYNLEFVNPELAKEWHTTKNRSLKPTDVTPKSEEKAWWICSKGHEWQSTILNRSYGSKCPYCINRKTNQENNLQIKNPKLSEEWHPTKNGLLKPRDVTPNSGKKVWWNCNKGHEWIATVSNRSYGSGCPFCRSQTSLKELRIYSELKTIFKNISHKKKIAKKECDILLENHKIAIEYDGEYWHRKKVEKDINKNNVLSSHGITVIRVREPGLSKISRNDIEMKKNMTDYDLITEILKKIEMHTNLNSFETRKIENYIKNKKLLNESYYYKIIEHLPKPLFGTSLFELKPNLSKEWNQDRNIKLTPSDITSNSHMSVWWKCKKGHEWQAIIKNRYNGAGCPYCANLKVNKENSLLENHKALCKEWDYAKNSMTPNEVVEKSFKKVWWKCKKGHEWNATIYNRSILKQGCPYCNGKKVSIENSLLYVNPNLSREWNILKNKNLRPDNVTSNSGKNVWWKCKKGHEWKTDIKSRNKGSNCPYCSGKKASKDINLQIDNPILSLEWNYIKNDPLIPKDFTKFSNKKVWWKCKHEHEWQSTILNRSNGSKCPYCAGRKASKDNNLLIKNPIIAMEWHPTKNGSLRPSDITPGSQKKVWWKCKYGHDWTAIISKRNKGTNCPVCYRNNIR